MSTRDRGKVPKEKILDVGLESGKEEEDICGECCGESAGMHNAERCEGT